MSAWSGLGAELRALAPHVAAVALIATRLLPVTLLCPILGGAQAPTTVRLSLVLALAMGLHGAGGVMAPQEAQDLLGLVGLAARELTLGTALGLLAGLPFDSARMGGRFVDLFRGSSAEAALPLAGSRESATGELLHLQLLALASAGVAGPVVVAAVWRSFGALPLGHFVADEVTATEAARAVASAFSVALAIGAPIAAASLAVDGVVGLVSRVAPQVGIQETAAPARILGGGALLWLGVSVVSARLVEALGAVHFTAGSLTAVQP